MEGLAVEMTGQESFDEMVTGVGGVRPHWQSLMGAMRTLPSQVIAERIQRARRQFQENGVSYNVYSDPKGLDRPWQFDVLPVPIPEAEWADLEAGLAQRATLLESVLADIYGPQRLLADQLLPPALVQANPRFLRACRLPERGKRPMMLLYAADLIRGADGQWWVLSDRIDAPSGLGYALENRNVLARSFPELFRACPVKRLRPFFSQLHRSLQEMARLHRDNPHIVLLTPGPLNETYFEHVFLARELGLTLAEGADLTVRGGRVFLKTLSGLKTVDVILRRLDSEYADPLELRPDSALGVVGLMQAVRDGSVRVANALGCGAVEAPGLAPYLPGLCRHVLGEDMKLPSVAVWWCGQKKEREAALARMDQLIVRSAFSASIDNAIRPHSLSRAEKENLISDIRAQPHNWILQERLPPSATPVWSPQGLSPHPMVLRAFLVRSDQGWTAMPGGFVRVAADPADGSVSMQQGGISKDAWVIAGMDEEVVTPSLVQPMGPVELRRSSGELPSRAADNLFWLGRYLERLDNTARLLRSALTRVEDNSGDQQSRAALSGLVRLLVERGLLAPGCSTVGGPAMAAALMEACTSGIVVQSLFSNIQGMAPGVRDRLSKDLHFTLTLITGPTRETLVESGRDLSAAIDALDGVVAAVAAFGGMVAESMTRHGGWRFLDMGRKIERSQFTLDVVRAMIQLPPSAHEGALGMMLELCDSTITYRSRYLAALQVEPVLDLILADQTNPRSVAYQLAALTGHLEALAPLGIEGHRSGNSELRIVHSLLGAVLSLELDLAQREDVRQRLDELLADGSRRVSQLSDAVTRTFFSHVRPAQAVGGGVGGVG